MRVLAFVALLAALPGSGIAPAQELPITSTTLDNGMKVLVEEDHNIPSVALYFFFKVGSRNERPGATGLSHFFEHMMFNGAAKYGPKQFDQQMDRAGGSNNAYTSEDMTVYTDWFPSNSLELMMDMESDRIQHLAFDPKIIKSERGVVYSERRTSVDNSNRGLMQEQMQAAAYEAHPYHWPVVGWPSDIEAWTMDDLKQHFAMGYAPNNCVMVAVGDVKTDEVLRLAKKYMGPIPRHDPPPPVRTIEPKQTGERRAIVHKPAQLPLEMIAYHIPAAHDSSFPTIEVLRALLAQGQSSRLYRRLVDRDQLSIDANAFAQSNLDPGLFVISLQPRSGVETAQVEKAAFEEVEKLRSAPVSDAELQRAKNQLLADSFRQLQTIAGRANLIGRYEVLYGDYHKLSTRGEDIEAVTIADVQKAAAEYLNTDNRTVVTLVPEKKTGVSE
jgi:zinc protease